MSNASLWIRARNRSWRTSANLFSRKLLRLKGQEAIISFTFDDFPRSALHEGGEILKAQRCAGTYYASAGIIGSHQPTGEMFTAEDLGLLLEQGHELGCHTFGHDDARDTRADVFEASIVKNQEAMKALCPVAKLRTLGYPKSEPRLRTKRVAARYFACCKAGGQRPVPQNADLSYLPSFYIEQSRERPEAIREMIDRNREERGWLIFSTHDVSRTPTRFGVTPELFKDVVTYAIDSGAKIMTVVDAWQALSS